MSDHPLGDPLRKRLPRPPSTPASSCFACLRPGTVSTEQTNVVGQKLSPNTLRFDCPACASTWTTNKQDALAHGRFLDRAGLRG